MEGRGLRTVRFPLPINQLSECTQLVLVLDKSGNGFFG